jgi:hypothetical protein
MARAQTKSQDIPAQGEDRLQDAPRGPQGSEPNSQHAGKADGLYYGQAGDYRSIHGNELTMHGMHEGDSDAPMHPGWDIDFSRRNLKTPEPRAGFDQRWIRCENRDNQDLMNLQKQRRMGWMPRDPSTIPEHQHFYPVMKHSSGPDCIYVGGMMLCERPIQLSERARQAVRAKVQRQKAAVSEAITSQNTKNMRRGLPPIHIEERREIERGRRPVLQDD